VSTTIQSPDSLALDALCAELARRSGDLDSHEHWPREQLNLCGSFGVFRWFLAPNWGGFHWALADVLRGYMRLSSACLTKFLIVSFR
jgi:hypothetical protein